MSYYDLPKGSPDCELGRAIYLGALSDRRGFRNDQIGIEDDGIWREIFECIGQVARRALAAEGGSPPSPWQPIAYAPNDRDILVGGWDDDGNWRHAIIMIPGIGESPADDWMTLWQPMPTPAQRPDPAQPNILPT